MELETDIFKARPSDEAAEDGGPREERALAVNSDGRFLGVFRVDEVGLDVGEEGM